MSQNNPRIRFGNDDKNVIYRDTDNNDNMVIQINNDELINMSNLQNQDNIVLGTTEPILVINDTQSSSSISHSTIRLSNNVPEYWDISAGITGTTDDFSFHIGKDGTEYVNIATTGVVGIGVLHPTKKLDVAGNALLRSGTISLSSDNTRINGDHTDIRLYTNNQEQVILTQSGDLGIGTNIPSKKLDVNGDALIRGGDICLTDNQTQISSVNEGIDFLVQGSQQVNINKSGDLTVNQDLGVSGNSYLNNLDLTGVIRSDVTINKTLNVLDNATFQNDIGVSQNTYLNQLNVGGIATFQDDIGVSGKAYINNLKVQGIAELENVTVTSFVVPTITVTEELGVTGISYLNAVDLNTITSAGTGTLTANTNLDLNGTLDVSGGVTMQNNLLVSGTLDVDGAVDIDNTLNVLNDATFQSNIDITGNSTIGGNTDISGNLSVSGPTIINDTLDVEQNAIFQSDIGVSGKAYLNELQVDGKLGIGITQPEKALDIDGDLFVRGGDICLKDSTFSIGITNDRLTFNTNSQPQMYIEQDGSVVIGLTYPTDTDERFYVDGSARIQGDLDVRGNISLEGDMINIGVSTYSGPIQIGSGVVTVHVPGDLNIGGAVTFTEGNSIGFVTQNTGDATDFGIFGNYLDTGVTETYSGIGRDATYGNWAVFNQTTFPTNPEFKSGDWNLENFSAAKIGIGTQVPTVSLSISGTDAVLLPVGNNSQRPTAQDGLIRYNNEILSFEGYSNGAWGAIGGGAQDQDQDTYIRAEDGPGLDNDELDFFTAGTQQMYIGVTGQIGIGTDDARVKLDINASDAIRLPIGNTAERPSPGQDGFIRYNNEILSFEGYSNGSWGAIGGGAQDQDQDTYIRAEDAPGADNDELDFFTAGTQRMVVKSDGKVGIGTNDPNELLHVHTTGDGIIQLTNDTLGGTASDGLQIRMNSGGIAKFVNQENGDIAFEANGAERMRIDPDGNVGIGTNNPSVPLHINSNTAGNSIIIQNSNTSGQSEISFQADSNTFVMGAGGSAKTGDLENKFFIWDNGTRFVIDTAGNIGIGSNIPQDKLDVNGTGRFNDNLGIGVTASARYSLEINDTDAILLPRGTTAQRPAPYENGLIRYNTDQSRFEGFSNGNWSGIGGGAIDLDQDTYIEAESAPGADEDILKFYTAGSERMSLSETGNLLIGVTSTPLDKKLVVDGDACITGDLTVTSGSINLQSQDAESGIQIGTSNPNIPIQIGSGDVTVYVPGDLVVQGDTFLQDYLLHLARSNTENDRDFGFYGKYVETGTTTYTGFARDASYDTWGVFDGHNVEPGTTLVRSIDWNLADFGAANIGIGTMNPSVSLHVSGTDAILVPVGDTSQRPTATDGLFRYNTQLTTFEGYSNGSWGPIGGGAADQDGDTYIQAETSVGADEDELQFFTAGVERMNIGSTGLIQMLSNNAVLLPVGNTAERPSPQVGLIRYNNQLLTFEGYSNGSWGTIGGGAQDQDMDTYIQAETAPGADNDQLQFFTAGTEHIRIENDGQVQIGITTFDDQGERLVVDGDSKFHGDMYVAGGENIGLNVGVSGRIEIGTSYPETTIQIGQDDVTLYVPSDLVVGGNVFYNSNFIQTFRANVEDTGDSGWYSQYVDAGVTKYTGIARDSSKGKWVVFDNHTDAPGDTLIRTGDWTPGPLCVGDLEVSGTGNISGTLGVTGSINFETSGAISFSAGDSSEGIQIGISDGSVPIQIGNGEMTVAVAGDLSVGGDAYFNNIRSLDGSQDFIGVTGHLYPNVNETFDLGTTTQRWRDLYLSGDTIQLGNVTLSDSGGKLIVPALEVTTTLEMPTGNIELDEDNFIGNNSGLSNLMATNFNDGSVTNNALLLSDNRVYCVFDADNSGSGEFRVTKGTGTLSNIDTVTDTNPFLIVKNDGKVGLGTTNPGYALEINSTGAVKMPSGTTGQRPTGTNGLLRYNSTTNEFEGYVNGAWDNVGGGLWTENGSEIYYNGGNVGIGTDNPAYPLDLRIDQNATTTMRILNNTNNTAAIAELYVQGNGGNVYLRNYSASYTTAGANVADSALLFADDALANGLGIAANNDIKFWTGGSSAATLTERMRINSSGNVGIGTTNPQDKLQINQDNLGLRFAIGSGAYYTEMGQYTTIDPNYFIINSRGNSAAFGTIRLYCNLGGTTANQCFVHQSRDRWAFHANNVELFRIQEDGKVGIGTNDPIQELHIHDSSATNSFIHMTHTGTGATSTDGSTIGVNGVSDLLFINRENADIEFRTNNTERMRIDSNGNVGIGTATPARLLHIHEDSSGGNFMQFTNTTTGSASSDGFAIGIDLNEDAVLTNQENSDMIFYNNGGERMRIDSSGNVGIGTGTPVGGFHGSGDVVLHIHGASLNRGCAAHFTVDDAPTSGFLVGVGNGNDARLETQSNESITFYTNATERFQIRNDGQIIITGSGQFFLGNSNPTINFGTSGNESISMSGGTMIFREGAANVVEFLNSGSYANKIGGGTWGTISDRRIKTNERAITDPLGKVCSLEPKHFEYVNVGVTANPVGTRTGFIAQEVETVFPGHVSESYPLLDQDQDLIGVSQKAKVLEPDFIPYIVGAIKQHKEERDQEKIDMGVTISNLQSQIVDMGVTIAYLLSQL